MMSARRWLYGITPQWKGQVLRTRPLCSASRSRLSWGLAAVRSPAGYGLVPEDTIMVLSLDVKARTGR